MKGIDVQPDSFLFKAAYAQSSGWSPSFMSASVSPPRALRRRILRLHMAEHQEVLWSVDNVYHAHRNRVWRSLDSLFDNSFLSCLMLLAHIRSTGLRKLSKSGFTCIMETEPFSFAKGLKNGGAGGTSRLQSGHLNHSHRILLVRVLVDQFL